MSRPARLLGRSKRCLRASAASDVDQHLVRPCANRRTRCRFILVQSQTNESKVSTPILHCNSMSIETASSKRHSNMHRFVPQQQTLESSRCCRDLIRQPTFQSSAALSAQISRSTCNLYHRDSTSDSIQSCQACHADHRRFAENIDVRMEDCQYCRDYQRQITKTNQAY